MLKYFNDVNLGLYFTLDEPQLFNDFQHRLSYIPKDRSRTLGNSAELNIAVEIEIRKESMPPAVSGVAKPNSTDLDMLVTIST